jgi:hypothetical protein
MTAPNSLRRLEAIHSGDSTDGNEGSALEDWYLSVRDKDLNGLEDGDVCIALRQRLFPDYVVPLAIERLEGDPLAGEKYDGEMIVALKSVLTSYWASQPDQSRKLKPILGSAANVADSELLSDINDLIAMLG